MLMRGGKVRFLFWSALFAVFLYLWILILGAQAFVFGKHPSDHTVAALFILYGLLILTELAGTIVAILIGNRFYTSFFGAAVMITFGTLMAAKAVWG